MNINKPLDIGESIPSSNFVKITQRDDYAYFFLPTSILIYISTPILIKLVHKPQKLPEIYNMCY